MLLGFIFVIYWLFFKDNCFNSMFLKYVNKNYVKLIMIKK